jgi:hypothetical protein
VKLRLLALILFVAFSLSCSRFFANEDAGSVIPKDCLDAVTKALGPDVQVAKYGHLIGQKSVEVVAYTKHKKSKKYSSGVAVSKLVVLQKKNSHWDAVLNVSKQLLNPFGYIGIDFIDDSQEYPGWLVSFYDQRPDDVTGFSMSFGYLRSDGEVEGISVEISWNPAADRFQEFVINEAPEGFRSEIKNPPHRK